MIYLDHNATTPIDPTAAEAMMPFIYEAYGNPSSPYPLGTEAKEMLEVYRNEVALLLGCHSHEILFTSGGSESNNWVLKGLIDFNSPEDYHIITSPVEHPAIINPAMYLMELGVRVTILRVDSYGRVDPEDVERALESDTTLISIMLANNETGTIQPIKEISRIAKEHNVSLHTDAAQALGKVPLDVDDLGVDFLTVAGHKLYAPKGIGALYIRDGQALQPLIHGGGQEMGKRAGTENMIFCAALGTACRVARERLRDDVAEMAAMRDRLQASLFGELDNLVLNGHPDDRLPNTLNVSVPRMEGGMILEGLPTIMASTGAACHDKDVTLSHVLSAMGVPPEIGMGALRLTVGRSNTMDQIEEAAGLIIQRIKDLRDRKLA